MNKRILSDEVNQFLEDVKEQIQYKPIREEIKEELKAHIEDRSLEYLDMGIGEEEAFHKAIEQMGDPSMIGVMLNENRQVKNYWPLLSMVLAAVVLGILNNMGYYWSNWGFPGMLDEVSNIIQSSYYFVWGFLVLYIIYQKGYITIVKHTKLILLLVMSCFLMERVFWLITTYGIQRSFYYSSHVISYNFLLIFAIILTVLIFRWRSNGMKAMILSGALLLAIVLWKYKTTFEFALSAILILIVTCSVTTFYMISKGYLKGNKKKLVLTGTVVFLTVIGTYGLVSFQHQEKNLQLFLHPEKQAVNHWEDGYNGVLIKELLSKAGVFGQINLTKEELMNYGTGAWYFDEEEVSNIIRYLHYDITNVTLEDILPQHYHNNYRVAYWILDYGWFPATVIFAFMMGLYGMLYVVTNRIKNKLGHILAFSCSVCLTVQMLLYLFGNMGYQYGWFSTLPFISEGLLSITTNMILVGLILSAYRYDSVITEEKHMKQGIRLGSL